MTLSSALSAVCYPSSPSVSLNRLAVTIQRVAQHGDNTELRDKLHGEGLQYVLSVSPETTVFTADTQFTLPEPRSGPGRCDQAR